jgi:hypothetical protein
MALRVRWRGAFGRKTSAALRSVYVLVLGLGGWFVGVLIVLTAFPTVPIDDELVAALSVGMPIGLGVYLAWVHRDWSARVKTTGFAAAMACALVGAWLGFAVVDGLASLLTTIAGAAVGANLALVLLDITWARRAEDRLPSHDATETLAASPTTG